MKTNFNVDLKTEIDSLTRSLNCATFSRQNGLTSGSLLNSLLNTGEYLILRRKALNLSQRKLGLLVGYNEDVIRHYEKTKYRNCSLSRITHIVAILDSQVSAN